MSSRGNAEKAMAELAEIGPQLSEAYEAYMRLSVAWYDRWERLQYYRKRGVVSAEEIERFPKRPGMDKSEKSYNQRLKEYRADKKGKG